MKLSKTKSRLTQSAFFEVVFRPFKQGTVQSFNGQQSFVKSNCERSCCTVNSRRKGKVPFFVTLFVKGVLHCTTRLTEQVWNILSSDNAKGIVSRYRTEIQFSSNSERVRCTANSRRKGKIHFAVPFLQSSFTLHYTAKKTIREVLHMQEMFSFNTRQLKVIAPKMLFQKALASC